MKEKSRHLIPVHIVADRFEGDLMMDALRKEGVPALMQTFEETAYDGLFVPQRGWGRILAPAEDLSKAREIIQPLLEDKSSPGIYEDPAEIDPLLWDTLEQADPEAVCRSAGVPFDRSLSAYRIPFLNNEYHCDPGQRIIRLAEGFPYAEADFEFHLAVLHYLLDARPAGVSGKWVSEKDLPGGSLFFQGPHRFPVAPLLKRFGSEPDVFRAAAQKLQGSPVQAGDLACRLWPFPNVPLLFVLWLGDEEFEPALHVRFDETVTRHLPDLDVVWALVNVVCRHFKGAADEALKA